MWSILRMTTRSCTFISESEAISGWNWKAIRGGDAGRRGTRWHKVNFTLDDFLALRGLSLYLLCYLTFWVPMSCRRLLFEGFRNRRKFATKWFIKLVIIYADEKPTCGKSKETFFKIAGNDGTILFLKAAANRSTLFLKAAAVKGLSNFLWIWKQRLTIIVTNLTSTTPIIYFMRV